MRLYFSVAGIAAAAVFSLSLSACNLGPQPRRYTEIAFHAKSSPLMGTRAPLRIRWNLTQSWIEEPGGDPLRLASFLVPDSSLARRGETDPKAVDVSIVQLAGEAGG